VPEPVLERATSFARARNLRVDLMRCRERIGKFLLRRELHYPTAATIPLRSM